MSILARGQKCVIVGGCPENISLIIEVICRIGPHSGRKDAYWIRTVSGRPFHQLWIDLNGFLSFLHLLTIAFKFDRVAGSFTAGLKLCKALLLRSLGLFNF